MMMRRDLNCRRIDERATHPGGALLVQHFDVQEEWIPGAASIGPPCQARAELALALDQPIPSSTAVADAGTRFLARGGQWSPAAAVRRRIEQTALGRQKCDHV